jgi:uncharacterized protein
MSAFAPSGGPRVHPPKKALGVRPPSEREIGYDVARAIAFFGMAFQHFLHVMTDIRELPSSMREAFLANVMEALDGRFAALFVVLAGVGLSLMTRRARETDDQELLEEQKRILRRRAWFLFFTGAALSHIWVTEILHFYAVYIAIACFILHLKSFWILITIFNFIGLYIVLYFIMYYDPFSYKNGMYNFWNGGLNNQIGTSVNYHSNFDSLPDVLREIFFYGAHPVFSWFALFAAGLWLGRQNMRNRAFQQLVFFGALFVTLFTETLVYKLEPRAPLAPIVPNISPVFINDTTGWERSRFTSQEIYEHHLEIWRKYEDEHARYIKQLQFHIVIKNLLGRSIFTPGPFFILSAGGAAIAAICLCHMLADRFRGARVLRWLQAAGQMSLSLYVGHILLGMGWLYWQGFLKNNPLDIAIPWTIFWCAGSVAFAVIWKRFIHERGPLEWAMRRVAG